MATSKSKNGSVHCVAYQRDNSACTEFMDCNNTCELSGSDKFCHTMFQNSSAGFKVAWSGCVSDDHCTNDIINGDHCILHFQSKHVSGVHYYNCCCDGNMCNRNIHINETNLTPPTSRITATSVISPTKPPITSSYKLFYYSVPPVVGTIIVIVFLIYLWQRHKQRMNGVRGPLIPPNGPATPPSTRPVSWVGIVSRGQFGCVWKATYEHKEVAIKVIQAQERASWETERNMYENHSLVNENILKFYSAEKRLVECNMYQYWIVTQYHDHGSLSDYLHNTILNFDGMLKLMLSMVNGLVFLHSENLSLTPQKPIIAHRDFKSRNVLVRDNLTCCISDFGSACSFTSSYESDEIKAQVGTKRYMAPEVLQGAIAFQAESFLNIDMYALALVMWELLSRCDHPTAPVDNIYQSPYEKEVGPHPTIDDMRTIVLDKKIRPMFKPEWSVDNRVNEICNTIEECWDDEGDARLSAHCVYIRLKHIESEQLCDGQSQASSGYAESTFINDQVVELSSSQIDIKDEGSYSSTAKVPLLVEISC